MGMIIVTGKEVEKIKGEFESVINGMNMVGKIPYDVYSKLFDVGAECIQKAYELGKSELETGVKIMFEKEAEEYATKHENTKFLHLSGGVITFQKGAEFGYRLGLEVGKKDYSKIYMLGRKDEREQPCPLCKNPISICKRCERYRKLCEGLDSGAYVGGCEDFIYKEIADD